MGILRSLGRPLALTAVLMMPTSADAGPPDGATATYEAAEAAWLRCFPTGARVPALPEPNEADTLVARRTRTGFSLGVFWHGSGIESVAGGFEVEFQPRGCRATWVQNATYEGAIAFRVRIGWVNRAAPDTTVLTRLVAKPARPAASADAFARAWLLHACPGGFESLLNWNGPIEGPIAPAQPWHRGTPQPSGPTFWSSAALDAIGATAPLRTGDDDEAMPSLGGPELTGIIVPDIQRAARTFTAAGVDLFEVGLSGRNGGRAIALRERASNRYRWVVITRGCVQGTTVMWLGTVGSRIVGVTRSRNSMYAKSDAILVIDVPSGTAWAVRLPEPIRDSGVEDDDAVRAFRASLSGTTLALHAGDVDATLDLAPMLALIPTSP